jgi:hypothetical protein
MRGPVTPPRDDERFVVEPKPPVFLQHLLCRVEISAVGDDGVEPLILDLIHIDRRVPCCEKR